MGNIAGGIFIFIMGIVIIVLGKESGNLRVLGIAGAVMALFGALVIWEEIWGLASLRKPGLYVPVLRPHASVHKAFLLP